jgi:hypothetical protein
MRPPHGWLDEYQKAFGRRFPKGEHPMTLDTIAHRLATIRDKASGDPEVAHALEDALWRDVLVAISEGHETPATLAAAALLSQEIEFERFYA